MIKATVHYFFRGSWWPPCRAQLTALNDQIPNLTAAGVSVVVTTAEPGGEDAVWQRLEERNVPKLDFVLRSDPNHNFLNEPNVPKDIFVMKDYDWDVSGPYKMIQPALYVIDTEGKVIEECSWSWTTMGSGDGDWDTRVTLETGKDAMLVTVRPVMSYLLPAIEEKRPVKLTSTHEDW